MGVPLSLSGLWTAALLGREEESLEDYETSEEERRKLDRFRLNATCRPDIILMEVANGFFDDKLGHQINEGARENYGQDFLALMKKAEANFKQYPRLFNHQVGEIFTNLQRKTSLGNFPFGRREILVLLLVASKKPFDAPSFLRVWESFRES